MDKRAAITINKDSGEEVGTEPEIKRTLEKLEHKDAWLAHQRRAKIILGHSAMSTKSFSDVDGLLFTLYIRDEG